MEFQRGESGIILLLKLRNKLSGNTQHKYSVNTMFNDAIRES